MDQLLQQSHAPQCNSVEPEKSRICITLSFGLCEVFIHRYETIPKENKNGADKGSRDRTGIIVGSSSGGKCLWC